MKDLRIAAVICRCPLGQIDDNIEQVHYWTRQAKAAGAALICFPEMNITGYGNNPQIAALAQPIPGRVCRLISNLAAESGLLILAGMAEHNPEGKPFAAHCVFQPDGRIDVYRKLYLAPSEKDFYAAGNSIPVFSFKQTVFGIQLCYDAHFPELSTQMAASGVEVIFLPHASPRGDAQTKHQSWMRHLSARAFDNSTFIVACNQIGDNGGGLQFPGNAVVIDPSGIAVENRLEDSEGLLLADLKASALQRVRNHPMRYFFPNRRTDIYQ